MAATIAAIVGATAAAAGAANTIFGGAGSGTQQRQDISAAQLAQAQNNAIQARINAAYTTKLGQAGYTDSQGNSYQYDPGTNSWVSTLGKLPAQVQTAADQAAISRNTTDLAQAQGANARADMNAARAQPLIDAAQRRLANFQPTTGSQLGALLGETAANANTTAYRPVIQDTLRTFARTGTAAGPVLADIGRRSSADLRQSMIDAQVQGMTQAGNINNQNRSGLATDLSSAITAGTPQFQYPGIVPSTNTKDMLTALQNRAGSAAYSSALGNQAITSADKQVQDASTGLAGTIPADSLGFTKTLSGIGQLNDLAKSDAFKTLYGSLFPGNSKGVTPGRGGIDDPNLGFGTPWSGNASAMG
jgi:hypothetical protein